jgi:hypothetical protein
MKKATANAVALQITQSEQAAFSPPGVQSVILTVSYVPPEIVGLIARSSLVQHWQICHLPHPDMPQRRQRST